MIRRDRHTFHEGGYFEGGLVAGAEVAFSVLEALERPLNLDWFK
jgi:hypothetical protein